MNLSNESFDRELFAPASLSPRGFISRNELKFQSETQEIIDFPIENNENIDFSNEILDLSKGKYSNYRQKGLFSLLQVSKNLIELDLSSNSLVFFPIELIHLTFLRTLKLDYNEIKSLSYDIDKLTNIEFLSISNNFLTNLPQNFAKMKNLKVLNIGKNLLKDISPVCSIKSLEILYIYGNSFTEIPIALKNLENIKEFALEWWKYTEPAINPVIKKPQNNRIFEKLFSFLGNKTTKNVDFFEFLRFFSTEKLDFQQKDAKGRTFLHNAALYEELGVLTAISSKNPKLLNLLDKDSQSPLTLSILEEKFRSVELLIDLGSDCLIGGGIFGSSLHLAVSKLNVKIVGKLIEKLNNGGNNRKINQDYDKNSPFHILFSIFAKNPENSEKIARKLMNFGLDPNLKNKEMYTALHIAVKKNQVLGIKFALEYNCNLERKKRENSEGNYTKIEKNEKNEKKTEKNEKNERKTEKNEKNIAIPVSKSCEFDRKIMFQIHRSIGSPQIEKTDNNLTEKSDFFFNFKKKGGNAKWSLCHLASFLGNIEILHLLDDASVDFFQNTVLHQDPLKVSYQSIVVIKTIRKAQRHWIFRNILSKKSRKNEEFMDIINDSEETIVKNMRKKQLVFRNNDILLSRGRKIKKSIEEIEENCEDMEEYRSEENVTQKMLNKSSDIANLSDREQSAKKHSKKEVDDEIFSFKKGEIGDLQLFQEEGGFAGEIERVYKMINKEESVGLERVTGFLYLEMMRLKIKGVVGRFNSIRLPINVFLLNEARISGKKAENIANWIEKIVFDEILNEISKGFREKTTENTKENAINKMNKGGGTIRYKAGGTFKEELKLFRRKNEKTNRAMNLLLALIRNNRNLEGFLTFFNENYKELKIPKILLYELIENTLKKENNKPKNSISKPKHAVAKSMNNVSVIINNNFYFTGGSQVVPKENIKKKKQSLSFWGISPERLENKENFSSKPYFLV